MRKCLLLITAMLFGALTSINAEEVKLKKKISNGAPVPNSLNEGYAPALSATYDESELTLNIENYYGDVTVTITDILTRETVASEEEEIMGSHTFNIDISSLPSALYKILIELEDGTVYYGIMPI